MLGVNSIELSGQLWPEVKAAHSNYVPKEDLGHESYNSAKHRGVPSRAYEYVATIPCQTTEPDKIVREASTLGIQHNESFGQGDSGRHLALAFC